MSPNFTDVCMVGAGHKLALPPPHPPHTNVCQFWQLYRAISIRDCAIIIRKGGPKMSFTKGKIR